MTAIPLGILPTGMVVNTALLRVSMTDTVLLLKFVTYTDCPFGVIAISVGFVPTLMDVNTVFVSVRITDTVLLPKFAT